jgi:hypothetical protein
MSWREWLWKKKSKIKVKNKEPKAVSCLAKLAQLFCRFPLFSHVSSAQSSWPIKGDLTVLNVDPGSRSKVAGWICHWAGDCVGVVDRWLHGGCGSVRNQNSAQQLTKIYCQALYFVQWYTITPPDFSHWDKISLPGLDIDLGYIILQLPSKILLGYTWIYTSNSLKCLFFFLKHLKIIY